VALVTGGGSGLGLAVTTRFLAEGARVVVLEVSPRRAEDLGKSMDGTLRVIVGDVRSPEDNERAVAEAVDAFGGLDTFVGNAGIYDNRVRLEDLALPALDAAFDELFAVDVKGYVLGARAAIPALRRSPQASIIFTASVSSLHPGFGGSLYVAAKHAIAGLTRQLAYELAPSIRVNAVAAGFAPTNLSGPSNIEQGADRPRPTNDDLPLGAVASSDDYAGLYVLLASDESRRTMTGTVLLADGGLSIWGPG
jgi:NAD(P)-dependent dehydrogenase (short-subunit alcohol dehydrogenase family)